MGDEWTLRLPPALVIGASAGLEDGPDVFGHVSHAIGLSGGHVAVADAMAGEIRVFDAEGRHVRTLGGRGDGPGEFAALWTLAELAGDTIAAVDLSRVRISVFAPSGAFARSFAVPFLPETFGPEVVGWLDDGTMLVNASARPPSADPGDLATLFLYTVGRDGEVLQNFGEFAGLPLGSNGLGLGFGPQAHFATSADLAWYGYPSRLELVGRDRSGSVRRIVRAERVPRAVTQAEIDEARNAVREQLSGRTGPGVDRILATEYAATHPVHGRFMFDEADNAWVERFQSHLLADPGGRTWDIFDAEGRPTGHLTTPAGFEITDIGLDTVIGIHTDSLGVQTVRVYRLDS